MIRATNVLVALASLAAMGIAVASCAPQPRSAAYFKAHHDEAAQVFKACKTGARRGEECQDAEAGVMDADAQARMKLYRKSF